MVLLILILVIAGAGIPAVAVATPDLAVRQDGFRRTGDSLRVVVENLGDSASPGTVLELRDRPFLGGRTGTSSHYRPLPGLSALWVDQEPDGADAARVTIHFTRGREDREYRGEIVFDRPGARLEEARPGFTADAGGRRFSWALTVPAAGMAVTFHVPAVPGDPPGARLTSFPEGQDLPPPTYSATRTRHGTVSLTIDCLDRPAARSARLSVPPLPPGERAALGAVFAGGALGEVCAWVDPDDALSEIREGNNVSTWTGDGDRWALSALHLHSCFSEGPGSFDWQTWYAAMSGYALLWWSEHDWRMGCREHLEWIGFEEDEPIKTEFRVTGTDAFAGFGEREVSSGERALRFTTGEDGGLCGARVDAVRKRTTYALASGVEVQLRLLARSLQPGDRISVGFDLSYHPGEARSVEYRFRWEGSQDDAPGAGLPWAPVLSRTVPTGGWVTVRLPVSRDAEAAWPNGSDDNLVGIWFRLEAGGAAEVLLDDMTLSHERCGPDLLRVEQRWTESYPNVRHQVGGEISYGRPHILRYGGSPEALFFDMEHEAGKSALDDAEEAVRVVHASSGLASWCHPLGVTRFGKLDPQTLEEAIDHGLAGVDAVEIGYRNRAGKDLSEYLALWGRICATGLAVTALGVNDSHYNQWAPWEYNFATWLEAPADDGTALLAALREGRAFFGDPVAFRGRVSLQVGAVPMGGTVAGAGLRTARIRLNAVGENRTVRLIADGETLREWTGVSGNGVLGEQVDTGAAGTIRAEIWSADGRPLAFTNPVYFDPDGSARRGGE